MQRDRRIRPGLTEAPAKHPALMVKAVEKLSGPGENGPAGGIKVLVERGIDCVEQLRGAVGRQACTGRSQNHPGPVQMKTDLLLAREQDDALHFGEVEGLAENP